MCTFRSFQEISLDRKSRDDCNNLLFLHGFMKKENEDDEVDDDVKSRLRYYTQKQLDLKALREEYGSENGLPDDDDDDEDDDDRKDEL